MDTGTAPASVGLVLRHYAVSAAIYGAALGFIAFCPLYRDLLQVSYGPVRPLQVYGWLYGLYLAAALPILLICRPASLWTSKNLAVAAYLARVARRLFGRGDAPRGSSLQPSYLEKHALAFLLIKLYYGPLMLNSAFLCANDLTPALEQTRAHPAGLEFLDGCYMIFVSGIFLLDSVLFFVGYHTEAGLLRNRLRFAETNLVRILVCVACYPPFNAVSAGFFGPSNYESRIVFRGDLAHPMTWILRGLAVLALLLLTSASCSLFTKASNLTNRGIVDWGPFRFVRHPGYVGKNLFWVFTVIPLFVPNTTAPDFTWGAYLFLCASVVWAVLGWGTIYYLRALTEEQFLRQDPDYVAYCHKVRYRFIPGLL